MSVHLGIHWDMVASMTGRLVGNPSVMCKRILRVVIFLAAG